jgi:hypothetical protein
MKGMNLLSRFFVAMFIILLCAKANGQNTFFIGPKKYPCSESYILRSGGSFDEEIVNVVIVKDGEAGMIVLSHENGYGGGLKIKGKVLIYLEDGSIITCIDRGKYDYVDKIATTIYSLTKGEIENLKTSNIHSIRYTLKCIECFSSAGEGDFSAINGGTKGMFEISKADFPKIIKGLF